MQIGWVGTGIMGSRMAKNLISAGHKLAVFDMDSRATEELVQLGATAVKTPKEAGMGADAAFVMVAYPEQVKSAILDGSEALINGLAKGSLLIDCTTNDPQLDRTIGEKCEQIGIDFLDAPVSGGPIGAEKATLSIMVGGKTKAFKRAYPLLELLGSEIHRVGPVGYGQHVKMVNQIAITANLVGVCEAYAYTVSLGIDPNTVFESIRSGAAGSFIMDFAWPRIQREDLEAGFYIEHILKDLRITLQETDRADIFLPFTALAKQLFHAARRNGGEGKGTQALILAYEQINRLQNK